MTASNSPDNDGTESTDDGVRFSDWQSSALNWDPTDRSTTRDSEEWPYAIDQAPPSEAEIKAIRQREAERRSGEQSIDGNRSDATEGDD